MRIRIPTSIGCHLRDFLEVWDNVKERLMYSGDMESKDDATTVDET
jgi:hypothetical protein